MSRADICETGAALRFIDVSATRSGRLIWSRATFEVPAGGIVAVIGANGSGKTTLLQMILGLHPVASGELRVFGRPPAADNTIGYVPQDYLSGAGEAVRAVDAVQLGLTGHRWGLRRVTAAQRNRVRDTLDAAGAAGFANARLASLSGGQRQRVAIAEALVASPRMLILDEPLAALDLRSQHEMVLLLARLHADIGMTTLVVAHDLNPLLPIIDSAVYLLEGRVCHAPIGEVLDEALLSELYGIPVRLTHTPDGRSFVASTS
jgi:zinc/manganese transport system ATP-binding protein